MAIKVHDFIQAQEDLMEKVIFSRDLREARGRVMSCEYLWGEKSSIQRDHVLRSDIIEEHQLG